MVTLPSALVSMGEGSPAARGASLPDTQEVGVLNLAFPPPISANPYSS